MGTLKWVVYLVVSGLVGIAVYQVVVVTLFGTPSFPDVYGNQEAGIMGTKFFYIAIGAPLVWIIRRGHKGKYKWKKTLPFTQVHTPVSTV